VLTLASGCFSNVTPLQPKASRVTIVRETERPLHCEVKGKITGTSRSSDEKEARTGAENDLRNQAAELKANFALVEADRSNRVGTGSNHDVFLGGKALLCQTEEMEAEQEKAEAKQREAREQAAAAEEAKAAEDKKATKNGKKAATK
jgi:hypothetical protein